MAVVGLSPSLIKAISVIPDPRKEKNRKHLLIDVLIIALCTCLAEGEGWTDCEDYACAHEHWFRRFLALPHGIPSHDVFREVFLRMDPDQLANALMQWVHDARRATSLMRGESTEPRQICLDGKTLRGSANQANEKTPFHLVSAWAHDLGLSIGQIAVGEKSNEIIALPKLLKTLNLRGAIVTIDAMGAKNALPPKSGGRKANTSCR